MNQGVYHRVKRPTALVETTPQGLHSGFGFRVLGFRVYRV